MQRAAGGTSQRLNPVLAMMRSRSSSPTAGAKPPACSIAVIAVSSVMVLANSVLRGLRFPHLRRAQPVDRRADRRIEADAPGVEMRDDGGAHARVPEFGQMLGDTGHGPVMPLAGEELADLICHVD